MAEETVEMSLDQMIDSGVEETFEDFSDSKKEELTGVKPEPSEPKPIADAGAPKSDVSAPRNPPNSWAKEQHEVWSKLDPKAQEYIELREKQMSEGVAQVAQEAQFSRSLRKVLEPYMADIQAARATPEQAINYLMNANQVLLRGNQEQRAAMFLKIAKDYGVDVRALAGAVGDAPAPNPEIVTLRQELNSMREHLTAAQRQQHDRQTQEVQSEVAAFWNDPAHPYATEVADHIVLLMANPQITLKDAYEQAVWANPVTRAKEQARLAELAKTDLDKKAREEADKVRRSIGTRVKGHESEKGVKGPLGTIDDTLKSTLSEIRGRTH